MFTKKKSLTTFQPLMPSPDVEAISNKRTELNNKDNPQKKNAEFINQSSKVSKAQQNFFKDPQKTVTSPRGSGNTGIPLSELEKHKTVESAWLSLNGIVYDVTAYIKYHPGGHMILKGCGIECSELFNKYHAWVNGEFLLKGYKLGYLIK